MWTWMHILLCPQCARILGYSAPGSILKKIIVKNAPPTSAKISHAAFMDRHPSALQAEIRLLSASWTTVPPWRDNCWKFASIQSAPWAWSPRTRVMLRDKEYHYQTGRRNLISSLYPLPGFNEDVRRVMEPRTTTATQRIRLIVNSAMQAYEWVWWWPRHFQAKWSWNVTHLYNNQPEQGNIFPHTHSSRLNGSNQTDVSRLVVEKFPWSCTENLESDRTGPWWKKVNDSRFWFTDEGEGPTCKYESCPAVQEIWKTVWIEFGKIGNWTVKSLEARTKTNIPFFDAIASPVFLLNELKWYRSNHLSFFPQHMRDSFSSFKISAHFLHVNQLHMKQVIFCWAYWQDMPLHVRKDRKLDQPNVQSASMFIEADRYFAKTVLELTVINDQSMEIEKLRKILSWWRPGHHRSWTGTNMVGTRKVPLRKNGKPLTHITVWWVNALIRPSYKWQQRTGTDSTFILYRRKVPGSWNCIAQLLPFKEGRIWYQFKNPFGVLRDSLRWRSSPTGPEMPGPHPENGLLKDSWFDMAEHSHVEPGVHECLVG